MYIYIDLDISDSLVFTCLAIAPIHDEKLYKSRVALFKWPVSSNWEQIGSATSTCIVNNIYRYKDSMCWIPNPFSLLYRSGDTHRMLYLSFPLQGTSAFVLAYGTVCISCRKLSPHSNSDLRTHESGDATSVWTIGSCFAKQHKRCIYVNISIYVFIHVCR